MKNGTVILLLLFLIPVISYSQTDTTVTEFIDSILVSEEVTIDSSGKPGAFGRFWSHDPHSVKQAALFSAVIPGLGQAYNEKYWKIPIVYAAIGTAVYFVHGNSVAYHDLENAYLLRHDDDSTSLDEYVNVFGVQEYTGNLSDEYLLDYIDQWKTYTDLNYVILSLIYVLNIVDAVVDAHLYSFDVSDDLSLQANPYLIPTSVYSTPASSSFGGFGLSLKLSIK